MSKVTIKKYKGITFKQCELDELTYFGFIPESTKKKFIHNTDKCDIKSDMTLKIKDQDELIKRYSDDFIGITAKMIIDDPKCYTSSSICKPGFFNYDVFKVHPEILHLLD